MLSLIYMNKNDDIVLCNLKKIIVTKTNIVKHKIREFEIRYSNQLRELERSKKELDEILADNAYMKARMDELQKKINEK